MSQNKLPNPFPEPPPKKDKKTSPKPPPKPPKKPGDPHGNEKPIDWRQFEILCGYLCTQQDIAHVFKICRQTLSIRVQEHYGEPWEEVYDRFCATGRCSLRRNQFVLSAKNAAMAIHLGKIWLGQKEVVVNETKAVTTQKAIIEGPDNGHRRINEPDDEEI